MSDINNGGPAFPHEDTGSCALRPGMTLRDYFAAKAMEGLIASDENSCRESSTAKALQRRIAESSYSVADAMLEARGVA